MVGVLVAGVGARVVAGRGVMRSDGMIVGGGGVQDGPDCVAFAHCELKAGRKNIATVQRVSANRTAPALTPMSKELDSERGGRDDMVLLDDHPLATTAGE